MELDPDGKHIVFTDGCGIGKLRLVGNKKQKIETFPSKISSAFALSAALMATMSNLESRPSAPFPCPIWEEIGIDVGLKAFLTDSQGNTIDNPRHYRKAEKKLKRLGRRLSRKQRKSVNRKKARKALASQHLKVQKAARQIFARKQEKRVGLVSRLDCL